MGLVVSTYKPLRDPAHNFASVSSANPMRFQLDVGVDHPSSNSVEPELLPAEGMDQVSFFASARRDGDGVTCAVLCPPGIAYEQRFEVVIHQFYYGLPKEGWSFVAGDKTPF